MAGLMFALRVQATPGAGATVALYTTPADQQAIVGTLVVCNTAAAPTTFKIRVAVAGAADAVGQSIFEDAPIAAKATLTLTTGLLLAEADVIRVSAAAAGVNFHAYGQVTG